MALQSKDPWKDFRTVGSERNERGEGGPEGGWGTLAMLIGLAAVVGWGGGVFIGGYLFFRGGRHVIKAEEVFDWAFWICGSGGSILSVLFVIAAWFMAGSREDEG